MKKLMLILMVHLMALTTLSAQKLKDKYDDINYEKVAYVAQEKTIKLDQLVKLDKKMQEKKIYSIYEKHEIKRQKKIRDLKALNKIKYKSKPNRVKVVYHEYDAKKDRESLKKLDVEVDAKIFQALKPRQQNIWTIQKKNENKVVTY